MNLIKGRIVLSPKERDAALDAIKENIYNTLENKPLNVETVINACDKLSAAIGQEHIDMLIRAGIPAEKVQRYLTEAKAGLRKENLKKRLSTELGEAFAKGKSFVSRKNGIRVKERIVPLGTLFHIAAGNQFGLSFYSALEGLLTGNINVVKLPSGDNGLSVMIFSELFNIEPRLKDYVYIFDYTSKDTEAIRKLMGLADAVIVWGGDKAVEAVRNTADTTTKIIEWGHRLSFAYVTNEGITDQNLYGLAENITETNQLLCSSCQGVYIDTDSMEDVYRFCESFLPVLEKCRKEHYEVIPIEIQAQTGIMVYTESLQLNYRSCRVFQGKQTALLAYEDSALETAIPYGNCWVKRLPRNMLVTTLRPNKSHLQTAGLLCGEEDTEELTELIWKAGVTRVTNGRNMSRTYDGAAHDGEYTLRRYTRIVSQEFTD